MTRESKGWRGHKGDAHEDAHRRQAVPGWAPLRMQWAGQGRRALDAEAPSNGVDRALQRHQEGKTCANFSGPKPHLHWPQLSRNISAVQMQAGGLRGIGLRSRINNLSSIDNLSSIRLRSRILPGGEPLGQASQEGGSLALSVAGRLRRFVEGERQKIGIG